MISLSVSENQFTVLSFGIGKENVLEAVVATERVLMLSLIFACTQNVHSGSLSSLATLSGLLFTHVSFPTSHNKEAVASVA
jgi:hypothetical protein